MTVDQISVFLENRVGQLAEVTELLAKNGVNLRALSLADTRDFGMLRLIVDDPERTEGVLREAGLLFTVTPMLAVIVPDEPGGLARVMRIFTDGGISLEYIYVFITREIDEACVICRVEDNERAAALLKSHGVRIAAQHELKKL